MAIAGKPKGRELVEAVEEAPRAEFTDPMAALEASLGGKDSVHACHGKNGKPRKNGKETERARAPRRAAPRTQRPHPARATLARKHARAAHR